MIYIIQTNWNSNRHIYVKCNWRTWYNVTPSEKIRQDSISEHDISNQTTSTYCLKEIPACSNNIDIHFELYCIVISGVARGTFVICEIGVRIVAIIRENIRLKMVKNHRNMINRTAVWELDSCVILSLDRLSRLSDPSTLWRL